MEHQPSAATRPGAGSLAPARYLLLTTFKRSGSPVSTPVHGVVHGGRAYFRAWSRSGGVKRLRATGGAAQLAPCGVLGLCSYGRPFAAAVRPLPGGEAGPVARKLAGKYPVRQRLLISPLERAARWRMMHFELLIGAAVGGQDGLRRRVNAHGGAQPGHRHGNSVAADPTGTGCPARPDA
jgi:PPOX class probable F420-dependent enzyme